MMCKKNIHFICLILSSTFLLQTVHAESDFTLWKKQQDQAFNNFQSEREEAFLGFLKSNWQSKEQQQPVIRDASPKPEVIPQAKPEALPDLPEPVITTTVTTAPTPTISLPIVDDAVPVHFYGHDLHLQRVDELKHLSVALKKDALANTWLSLSKVMQPFLSQVNEIRQTLQLSDWALYQLLHQYAEQMQLSSRQETMMVWVGLTFFEYDVRVSYDHAMLYLMLPSQQPLFDVRYVLIDQKKFYFIPDAPAGRVNIYQGSVFNKSMNFSFDKTLLAAAKTDKKHRTLSDERSGLSVDFVIDTALASYYISHPQLGMEWYFQANRFSSSEKELLAQLKRSLQGLTEQEQVSLLLSLIQYGFAYELDEKQWGREYYAATEHALSLQAIDCEDRSFLFARLVKEITGRDTIAVLYPGHVAVAVNLDNKNQSGVYYLHNNKKYYIADPTYIGAAIGQVMPNYANVKPEIIEI